MNADTWNDRDEYEASALEDREADEEPTVEEVTPFDFTPWALPVMKRRIITRAEAIEHYATPAYTSNLPVETQQLGLKALDITGEVVVTRGGTQLVCAACDAPFTIDQWLMRPYLDNGDLHHEECDTDRQVSDGAK